jgi:hypothetical protein
VAFWTRQVVQQQLDVLAAQVRRAGAAVGALDAVTANQNPPPGTPESYWSGVQAGLFDEAHGGAGLARTVDDWSAAIATADDEELAAIYEGLWQASQVMAGEAAFAQAFSDFQSDWGPAGTGARRELHRAQDDALRSLTGVGDLRRNLRRGVVV